MSWLEPVSTVVTAASLANQIAESSGKIKGQAKRLVSLIRDGKVILPVFGSGGVGKSTAGSILVGKDPLDVSIPYKESWLIEPLCLPGDVPGTILVAPGQIARAERYWPDLIHKANEGAALGIINVVSYGYHSFMGLSYKQHDLYEEGMDETQFMEQFLPARRQVEIDMLDFLVAKLAPTARSFFMISLISKQDLWWNERDDVKTYYTSGDYNDRIVSLRDKLGGKNFHHEYVPTSLTIANLRTDQSELLAPTAAGYDQATHLSYLQSFFDNLHSIATTHQKETK